MCRERSLQVFEAGLRDPARHIGPGPKCRSVRETSCSCPVCRRRGETGVIQTAAALFRDGEPSLATGSPGVRGRNRRGRSFRVRPPRLVVPDTLSIGHVGGACRDSLQFCIANVVSGRVVGPRAPELECGHGVSLDWAVRHGTRPELYRSPKRWTGTRHLDDAQLDRFRGAVAAKVRRRGRPDGKTCVPGRRRRPARVTSGKERPVLNGHQLSGYDSQYPSEQCVRL